MDQIRPGTQDLSELLKIDIANWPIEKILAYGRNPRVIPETAVSKVAASIREFGFRQPLVVDEGGMIIVGHTRLLAAKMLGLEAVPVHVVLGWSEAKKRAYRLADNRLGDESSFDERLLDRELSEVIDLCAADALDPSLMGFDADELLALKSPLGENLESDPRSAGGLASPNFVRLIVAGVDVPLVERALAATGEQNRAAALRVICELFLAKQDGLAAEWLHS